MECKKKKKKKNYQFIFNLKNFNSSFQWQDGRKYEGYWSFGK